jgi:hypothetical protein
MPSYSPPARAPSRPRTRRLAVGTTLYRVHAQAFSATEFNPTGPPAGLGGGRFDSLDGAPPYLYAAFSVRTAIAESLLRGVPFDGRGVREIPAAALRGRCLSELKIVSDLRLAALHGEGLSRIGQDAWLVHCDAAEYAATREWGSAIMRWLPSAAGLEWRPRNDDDGLAVCLYQDRAAGHLEAVRSLALWEGEGLAIARAALLAFGVAPPLGGME